MNQKRKTVVVIDDDVEMVELLRLIFRQRDISFIGVLSSEKSLSIMSDVEPDIVLLDLMMPDLNGWEVYRQMQASPDLRAIPVIILTVESRRTADRNGQYFAEAASYVTKPFDPGQLLAIVDRHLDAADNTERAAI